MQANNNLTDQNWAIQLHQSTPAACQDDIIIVDDEIAVTNPPAVASPTDDQDVDPKDVFPFGMHVYGRGMCSWYVIGSPQSVPNAFQRKMLEGPALVRYLARTGKPMPLIPGRAYDPETWYFGPDLLQKIDPEPPPPAKRNWLDRLTDWVVGL